MMHRFRNHHGMMKYQESVTVGSSSIPKPGGTSGKWYYQNPERTWSHGIEDTRQDLWPMINVVTDRT